MATRKPTFDINDPAFQAILKEAVAAQMAAQAAENASKAKAEAKGDIHARIIAAFQKAGFKDVVLFDPSKPLSAQPNVTCLTWNKWAIDCGRMVKKGEKAVVVKNYPVRLFHRSQTEVATPEQRKAAFAKRQQAQEKREAKANGAQPAA
jgi:hypothetical protein